MGNIVFAAAAAPRSAKRFHRLRLGTCITGTAALLLVGALPANAATPHLMTLGAVSLVQSVSKRTAARFPAPQDLTVYPVSRTVAAKTSARLSGLTVASMTGNVERPASASIATSGGDLTIHVGDVATTGDDAPAIPANADGNIDIGAGAITTTGAQSTGILANSAGSTTINVGSVTTAGDFSYGVRTVAGESPIFDPATGTVTSGAVVDLSVTAGTISTAGFGADGIYANNLTNGATNVTVDAVSTQGAQAWGVNVNGSGDVSVSVGSASTYGFNGVGVGAGSIGGNVVVTADSIYTAGDSSVGILAQAASGYDADRNRVNGNVTVSAGSVYTAGANATGIRTVADGNTAISADNVFTQGDYAYGISASGGGTVSIAAGTVITSGYSSDAIHVAANGDIAITADTIITRGNQSWGVYAHSLYGGTNIDVGTVDVEGANSLGIAALAAGDIEISADAVQSGGVGIYAQTSGGDITITAGSVATQGVGATGIAAYNFSAAGSTSVTATSVSTGRDYSIGIVAEGLGDVVINASTVKTSGLSSLGILGYSVGGSVSVTAGSVQTAGEYATGITTTDKALGGNSTIAAGTIATSGDHAAGVQAISYYGGADIDVGSVTTSGKLGIGINVATDYLGYQPASGPAQTNIKVGTITTSGDGGAGIVARTSGDLYIDAGSIETSGGRAHTQGGDSIFADAIITSVSNGDATIKVGSIKTTGLGSIGIYTIAFLGDTTIDAGAITTSGDHGEGVLSHANFGTVSVTVDDVTTSGAYSSGVVARAYGSYYDAISGVTVNAGTITTAGDKALGIVASSDGIVAIDAGTISTAGANAIGIYGYSSYGDVGVKAGAVSTKGDNSVGLVAISRYGSVDLKADTITTTGNAAPAVAVYAYNGAAKVDVGTVSTSGIKSAALLVEGVDATVTAVKVSTQGDYSNGIVIRSGGYGVGGTGVVTVDSVTTAGNVTAAIDAIASGDDHHAASMDITANTIVTTGQDAVGISAFADYGPLSIKVGSISTKGAESVGILAFGGAGISIQAGSITSAATSIYANETGKGAVTLGVTGKIASSAGDGVVLINQGGTTGLTIGSGGSVLAAGDAVAIQSGNGKVSIANAGTIAGGAGYAIDAGGLQERTAGSSDVTIVGTPATSIANSGTIVGAVKLGGGNDTLSNSGTFIATKDSDFGAGSDSFVNTGMLVVRAGTKPGTVALLGLDSFQNKGGLVDLRNGVVGDVLDVSGNYIGSGDAYLGLDAGGGKADELIVGAAAAGHTGILLDVTAKDAVLLVMPITLVKAGTGSAADAFSIVNADIGFIHYGLSYNAATGTFGLTSGAGAAVYRALDIPRASQAIWRRAADGWESHMAEKRDARVAGGNGSRLWGQAYGGVDTQDGHRSLDEDLIQTGYRQDYYGAQIGLDLAGKTTDQGGTLFGVTGSYISSNLNGRGSADRTRFDTASLGAYASVLSGPLFANLLGQYGHDWIRADNISLGYSDKLKGDSYGGELQVGARLGKDNLYLEPSAAISYVRSDIDDLHALGQAIDFDKRDGLTGKLGARIGSTADLGKDGKATFYLQAHYVHEFKGKNGLDLLSGGASDHVSGVRPGDYGQGAIGVNLLSVGRLSGFIEGDADVGGGTKGGGGRVGVSFKL